MSSLLPLQIADETLEQRKIYIEVILPIKMPKTLYYLVPKELENKCKVGVRVVVKLGSKKIHTGLVARIFDNLEQSIELKYIIDVFDDEPIINDLQIAYWEWIANYYCCTIGEVAKNAMPSHLKLSNDSFIKINTKNEIAFKDLSPTQEKIVYLLESSKKTSIIDLENKLKVKTLYKELKDLYEKGIVSFIDEIIETFKPKKEEFIYHKFDINSNDVLLQLFERLKNASKQSQLLNKYLLLNKKYNEPIRKSILLQEAQSTNSILQELITKGIFEKQIKAIDRYSENIINTKTIYLTTAQQKALDDIKKDFNNFQSVLLQGITGSGKTLIYLSLLDDFIEKREQVLFLVPDIVLTSKFQNQFIERYGNKLAIYHSKITTQERVEIWHKVKKNEVLVVLGVRSAVFLPFSNLKLIVIDEEHETTFKQKEQNPKYHTKDIAIYLGSILGAKTLLGSATPSFESFHNAKRNKFGFATITERYTQVKMPEIELVSLVKERHQNGMRGHFSSILYQNMQKTLDEGNQVILFQNRRGYAPVVECQDCGFVFKCQNCDISLTFHRTFKELICHYCGYKEVFPKQCIECNSTELKLLGFGTEQIEQELNELFPKYKSIRLDQETTRTKNAYRYLIEQFENNKAQILIGTQMVTKGLDFERVNLVGIINADQLFRFPDFRAVERSFSLMTQVAGRAGRRHSQGKVIIQTSNPSHPVFTYVQTGDYIGLYNTIIQERLEHNYPPFSRLINISLKSITESVVEQASKQLGDNLKEILGNRVLGPEKPYVSKIKNFYLRNIMIKLERINIDIPTIKKEIIEEVELILQNKTFRTLKISLDIDPY